ncbi:MAG TPA: Fe-Mn family superoxide dismutase [Candidatus Paceibacterota bacterium]|jgi:Fe-Mn family superoxide dismutase|nr:Fe-Mn family superoxide dismutase [Candidatus Paceibacterota bacterium]
MDYVAKRFTFPELDGISKKTMDEHIGLYQGYVKNFNAIKENLKALMPDAEKNNHALSELERRLSFEFGGMRLHEYYFPQLEGGGKPLDVSSAFAKQIAKEFGENPAQPVQLMKNIGGMRGPGWAILYWDPVGKCLQAGFSGEQHQGHFVTLPILLALDVWEHAFILDYGAQGKGKYIDAFFKNLNWSVVEKRFDEIAKQ